MRHSARIALCLFLFAASATAAVPWQVIKINGRDFLTLENVARFYGFAEPATNGKIVRLVSPTNDLQFQLDSREMLLNGVRNWLSYPIVIHEGKAVVSRIDLAKTLEPQLRPNMIQNLGRIQTIVLDPGHGGFDKGAISSYGYEKDYALDVARQLRPMLQAKGFRVLLTRESDVFVPLEVRAEIANRTTDSVFVSLHFNATDHDPAATGFEVYALTPRGAPSTYEDNLTFAAINVQNGGAVDAASIELASCVYHSLLGQVGEFDRGIKRARFAVLRLTKIPAILVEGGFLTERGESRLIANGEWRKKLADAVCGGIDGFRTLAATKKRPMLMTDYRRRKTESATPPEKLAPVSLSLDPLQPPPTLAFPAPSASPGASAPPSPTTAPPEH